MIPNLNEDTSGKGIRGVTWPVQRAALKPGDPMNLYACQLTTSAYVYNCGARECFNGRGDMYDTHGGSLYF